MLGLAPLAFEALFGLMGEAVWTGMPAIARWVGDAEAPTQADEDTSASIQSNAFDERDHKITGTQYRNAMF